MPIWFNALTAFGIGPLLIRDLYYHLYQLPLPGFLHFLMVCVTGFSLAGSIGTLFYLLGSTCCGARQHIAVGRWAFCC